MQFDASVFLHRIEGIRAAITTLGKEAEALSRDVALLRRQIPAERNAGRHYRDALDDMDAAICRMTASHDTALEAVCNLMPSSGTLVLSPARSPLDALCNAATTLAIIRNALGMLADDEEGITNLAPWQRELFTKSYGYIADVVETLYEAHKALRREKAVESGEAGEQHSPTGPSGG